MKNYYLIVLSIVAIFSFNQSFAQSCPPTGFSDGSSLYFFYNVGGDLCAERPATVTVESSIFTLVDCDDAYSIYDLTSGSVLTNANQFTADFGFGTCEYNNGSLTNQTLLSTEDKDLLERSIKVFPNPVARNSDLFVVLGSHMDVEINVYSVTGKLVLANAPTSTNRVKLSTASLSNGMYVLHIKTAQTSVTRKVIVMN